MKKLVLTCAIALGAMSASAQAIEAPAFWDNWSVTLEGGVTTPLHNYKFWKNMRGMMGLDVSKQVTPAFGIGVEGLFGINTSTWKNPEFKFSSDPFFDNSYVGLYGRVDLMNLFGGYKCEVRPFTIDVVAGAGWGHEYYSKNEGKDWNFFATKTGLNINWNINEDVSLSLRPSIIWNMSNPVEQSAVAYNANHATFNCLVGVTWHINGQRFECVRPYNQAEIDALNGQINDLRSSLEASNANANAWEAKANGLASELQACLNRAPQKEVVKEVTNNLNSVRYVFFRLGSSVITADQQPNVEMIAQYMKNHKDSKVVVKGYASADGPLELNIKLAQARAEAVKTALVNKYKINPDRIQAEGQGIGEMFSEESWNRVSICTLETSK